MQPGYVADAKDEMTPGPDGWTFTVGGTGFAAKLALELDYVPLDGSPIPLREQLAIHGARGLKGESAMPTSPGEPNEPVG